MNMNWSENKGIHTLEAISGGRLVGSAKIEQGVLTRLIVLNKEGKAIHGYALSETLDETKKVAEKEIRDYLERTSQGGNN